MRRESLLAFLLLGMCATVLLDAAEIADASISLSDHRQAAYALLEGFAPYEREQTKRQETRGLLAASVQRKRARHERKTTKQLLRLIEKDPFGYGRDIPAQVLVSREAESAPLLLKEIMTAKDDYLDCLVNMLAEMPSGQRDRVFTDLLRARLEAGDDFLRHADPVPMMLALAASRTGGASELVTRYATNPREDASVRAQARVALNVLGAPRLLQESKLSVAIENDELDPKADGSRLVVAVLQDLALHELPTLDATVPDEGVFEIERIESTGDEISAGGSLPGEEDGSWRLVLGAMEQGRMPIYYMWYTGPLAAAGYFGLVEKCDDTWLCVFWERAWIS